MNWTRRFRHTLLGVIATSIFCLWATEAMAQDLRIFTAVYDCSGEDAGKKLPVISRSVTLFHAGRAYDYVDAAGEVVLFEPTERRFRLLNIGQSLTTTIAFDELRQLLKVARLETENYAKELASRSSRDPKSFEFVQFQLMPRFEEKFDHKTGLLSLTSPALTYQAQTEATNRPELVEAYLNYADWTGQLNYLLHPGPLLPDCRLNLNQALRAHGTFATTVELRTQMPGIRHLRAQHTLHWELDDRDREHIQRWESLLKGESLKTVSLQEYQRTILAARSTSTETR